MCTQQIVKIYTSKCLQYFSSILAKKQIWFFETVDLYSLRTETMLNNIIAVEQFETKPDFHRINAETANRDESSFSVRLERLQVRATVLFRIPELTELK